MSLIPPVVWVAPKTVVGSPGMTVLAIGPSPPVTAAFAAFAALPPMASSPAVSVALAELPIVTSPVVSAPLPAGLRSLVDTFEIDPGLVVPSFVMLNALLMRCSTPNALSRPGSPLRSADFSSPERS